jgi:hypothetical protein
MRASTGSCNYVYDVRIVICIILVIKVSVIHSSKSVVDKVIE